MRHTPSELGVCVQPVPTNANRSQPTKDLRRTRKDHGPPRPAGEAGILVPVSRLDRITADPSICHGKPTIRGLRYPVENLLELLASGMTIDEIVADHADLERDDLLAALEYGAMASGMRRSVPLGAG